MKCEWSACYDKQGNKKTGCDQPATVMLHGKKKDFHFCDEHLKMALAFKEQVKKVAGIGDVAYG